MTSNSREAILDAAEQLVALHGYAGLSMRELSKHSGVAKSTLYHYFQDKLEIYLSVLERDVRDMQDHLTAAAAMSYESQADRLRAVIAAYMDVVLDRGIIALNALRRSGEASAQLSEFFCEHRHLMMHPFRTVLQDGINRGELRADLDIELATFSLVGMMNSFVAQRVLFECDADDITEIVSRDQIVEHTLRLFLDGVAKR